MKQIFAQRFAIAGISLLFLLLPAAAQKDGKKCFSKAVKLGALRAAKVWMDPNGYDPVVGYALDGPRAGAPPIDANSMTRPIACLGAPKPESVGGTTPKFYCSIEGVTEKDGVALVRYKIKPQFKGSSPDKRNGEIYGEFLSSRFSKALGFFADDEWVADVTCPDCEKSLTTKFQGAAFTPFQPAAGIELGIGKGLDADCDGKDTVSLDSGLAQVAQGGSTRAEIDAFKLWLAFIDHGDTKSQNQKFACIKSSTAADGTLQCEQSIFYISDMGSTFGHASSSEQKARLQRWKGRDPIKVSGGGCTTTAKGVGDNKIGEPGRALLAGQLQRLLDAERANGTITKVFEVSRNSERDQPAQAWTAEFIRKANTIINAKCR